jgi:hypothetical protein
MAHTFVNDDTYGGRCIYCDCRPYGAHAAHECTGHESCAHLHN